MPKPPPDPATDRKIEALRASGLPVATIAERLGVSRRKIHQRLAARKQQPKDVAPCESRPSA